MKKLAKMVPILLSGVLLVTVSVPAQQRSSPPKSNAIQPQARVDINQATVSELMKVPGMTPVWAARIVRFRPYRTKRDLVDKGIVNAQVYGRIENYVIAHRGEE